MKKYKLLLLSFSCLLLLNCRKNKEEPKLPPETTTGAMTFGCKVNGKVFVPRDGRGKPGLFVQYVYLGEGPGGGWYLGIPATNWRPNPPEAIRIATDSLFLKEGITYQFKDLKGSPQAFYDKGESFIVLDNDGHIHITKHDLQDRILSGTFFFTATNKSTREKVEITEGRFDIRY